jgi:hypothetical protein
MPRSPRGRRARRVRAPALLLLVAGLLLPPSVLRPATAGPIEGEPPYPPSERITDFSLDWTTFRRLAPGSDNWHTTWAGDGQVYSSWGDGGGLGGTGSRSRVSLGLARLTGNTAALLGGVNLIGGVSPRVAACWKRFTGERRDPNSDGPCYRVGRHGKSRSLLGLGGHLYAWVTPGSGTTGYEQARVYRAPLSGLNRWERGFAFSRNLPDACSRPRWSRRGRPTPTSPTTSTPTRTATPRSSGRLETTSCWAGRSTCCGPPRGPTCSRGRAGSSSRAWTRTGPRLDRRQRGQAAGDHRPDRRGPDRQRHLRPGARPLPILTEHTQKSAGYFALLEAPKP